MNTTHRNSKRRYLFNVSLVVGEACHLGKHGVLVDGPVLNSSPALPDDLLVLLEPSVQQEHLPTERMKTIHVARYIIIMGVSTKIHFSP